MSADPLARVRRGLSAEERVAAIVDAEDRGDHDEAVRLAAAAPPGARPAECPRCAPIAAMTGDELTATVYRMWTHELRASTSTWLRERRDELSAELTRRDLAAQVEHERFASLGAADEGERTAAVIREHG